MPDTSSSSTRSTSRRAVLREKCPDRFGASWREFRDGGGLRSVGIAAVFCAIAIAIVLMREDVIPYRPGQYVPQAILSRVDFAFHDKAELARIRAMAVESAPRVYKPNGDPWGDLQQALLKLPEKLKGRTVHDLPKSLSEALEADDHSGDLNRFYEVGAAAPESPQRVAYDREVGQYVADIRKEQPVVVPVTEYKAEWASVPRREVSIPDNPRYPKDKIFPAGPVQGDDAQKFTELTDLFERAARVFPPDVAGRIVAYTVHTLKPTYVIDAEATAKAQNAAHDRVHASAGDRIFHRNQPLIERESDNDNGLGTVISEKDWQILKAENAAFVRTLGSEGLKAKFGLAGMVVLVTAVMGFYVGRYQPRIVKNPTRAVGIGALLISMLLLAELAAIGTGPLFVFGIAPTILVAMILAIAYDQRFAIGVASMHGILVTAALNEGVGFFLIIWVGVLTCGFLLDEIRTRSKLIEVGGITALTMIAAAIAAGAVRYDPVMFIAKNCLYTGAAGLAVGFIVLGILPFIEKAFKITTGMTLLELADASQPLLRRLAMDAPGTYNHSLQVAYLAEAAAEAIGADSLLTRVAAYYHDIGKINKPDYFVENQTDGRNRHIHLTPNMSFHIITGHVKDGVALAKEYNLPPEIVPFIQQHHGTTLIEYFFDKAKKQHDQYEPDAPEVSEVQFRYAGPKPRSREIAILMLADAAESASRTLEEPTPSALEKLVHGLAMKRMLDGQFDECDLTMRDLEVVERSLLKTLTGIYHGRIAYPSDGGVAGPKPAPVAATGSANMRLA